MIVGGRNPQGDKPGTALFAAPVFGGEPEMLMPLDYQFANMSRDGKLLVILRREENGVTSVYTAPFQTLIQTQVN